MPDNETDIEKENRKKKRKKNLIVLAMIFGWVALIWLITMARIASAEENNQDIDKAFLNQRAAHQKEVTNISDEWEKDRKAQHSQWEKTQKTWNKQREGFQNSMQETLSDWEKDQSDYLAQNDKSHKKMQEEGVPHRNTLTKRAEKWHQEWQPRHYND